MLAFTSQRNAKAFFRKYKYGSRRLTILVADACSQVSGIWRAETVGLYAQLSNGISFIFKAGSVSYHAPRDTISNVSNG
jgi:hypothetical protein